MLNFFKKKKKGKREKKPTIKKEQKPAVKEVKKTGETQVVKKRDVGERKEVKRTTLVKIAPSVLRSLHIAEKATNLAKEGQYVFKVFQKTSKQEVKKAIKEIYNVDILKVRIIKTPKKKRRLGRTFGWKEGYKKAIITLKKGQEIEILPK